MDADGVMVQQVRQLLAGPQCEGQGDLPGIVTSGRT